MSEAKRIAVVSGGNKGLGFDVVRQLASKGITVVLTARDEMRGHEAVAKLRQSSPDLSGEVIFHQLDVSDSSSVASLAGFVKARFGRLDILVNNAGIVGANADVDVLKVGKSEIKWDELDSNQTYKEAWECFQTNYYGPKRMTETFIPLLQSSHSPTIVNVSSGRGLLQHINNERAKGILSNDDELTEEKIDEVLNSFLKDVKEGTLKTKGWPLSFSAYMVSKALLNAYTRVVAKKCPNIKVNAVCPGFVNTDMTFNAGVLSVEEGAERIVEAVFSDAPSGLLFIFGEVSPF